MEKIESVDSEKEDKVRTKRKKEEKANVESRKDKQLTKEEKKAQEPKIFSINEALIELRKEEKRKFNQSVDLIVNLQDFDIKKNSVNLFVSLPNKVKQVRVGAFLEKKSNLVGTITKPEFEKYKDKKEIKKLLRDYDFFVANARLMQDVATNFGRVLGPAGKMPSPQLGIITDESEQSIKNVLSKLEGVVRVKSKEPSIKLTIGKESMKDEEIEANIRAVLSPIINALPKKKENIRNIMLKFTMSKPLKIEVN